MNFRNGLAKCADSFARLELGQVEEYPKRSYERTAPTDARAGSFWETNLCGLSWSGVRSWNTLLSNLLLNFNSSYHNWLSLYRFSAWRLRDVLCLQIISIHDCPRSKKL